MNLSKQLQLYQNREIEELKSFFYDSDHIKDQDYTSTLETIFEFIKDIRSSKYIDEVNHILEYKLVQEELLGIPSIRLSLSDKDTYDIEYIIKLNIKNRFKDMYQFENLKRNIIYSTSDISEFKNYILS